MTASLQRHDRYTPLVVGWLRVWLVGLRHVCEDVHATPRHARLLRSRRTKVFDPSARMLQQTVFSDLYLPCSINPAHPPPGATGARVPSRMNHQDRHRTRQTRPIRTAISYYCRHIYLNHALPSTAAPRQQTALIRAREMERQTTHHVAAPFQVHTCAV